jgi:uncharacterized protein
VTDRDEEQSRQETIISSALPTGTVLTVVKRAPDGSEAARYPGEVVGHRPDSWLIVRATWTNRRIEVGGLSFCPGDELLEWFSPRHRFNAFAVFSAEDRFKGWYANVAYPVRLDATTDPPVLFWHDLYLDLVGVPDGSFTVRDEDELLASGMVDANPELHACILEARSELIHRFQRQLPPFADVSTMTPSWFSDQQNLLSLESMHPKPVQFSYIPIDMPPQPVVTCSWVAGRMTAADRLTLRLRVGLSGLRWAQGRV